MKSRGVARALLRLVLPREVADRAVDEIEDFRRRRGGGPLWYARQVLAWTARAPLFWPRPARWTPGTVRRALRSLRRRPLVPALAVGTLALAVGANVAVFTVVDGLLLASLPYDRPDELMQVWLEDPAGPDDGSRTVSPEAARAWAASSALEGSGVLSVPRATLTGIGDPQDVHHAEVSPGLLRRLGARPLHGRLLAADDPGRDVIVLSHAFWRTRLGADPEVVGRAITLDDRPVEVVGVLGPGFRLPLDREVVGWSGLRVASAGFLDEYPIYRMIAWQGPGAGGDPDLLQAELERLRPASTQFPGLRTRVAPLASLHRPAGTALPVLLGAVTLVLLLAAVNVSQLLLARGFERLPELGVRVALGAGPSDVRGLLLAEGLTLGALGSALGMAVAAGLVRLFVAVDPGHVPGWADLRVTPRVGLYAVAAALLVSAVSALLPALHATRRAPAAALGRRATQDRDSVRVQRALLTLQTAAALVLLVGSGLLGRSWVRLHAVDPGFDPEGLRVARVVLPPNRYDPGDGGLHVRFFQRLERELRARPEIAGTTTATALPGVDGLDFEREFREEGDASRARAVLTRTVGPTYFDVVGARLLAGRLLGPEDARGTDDVAVLSRTASRLLFRVDDPQAVVGRTLVSERDARTRVVGVVEDARERGLESEPPPMVFEPWLQSRPFGRMWVAVRPASPGLDPWPAVRAALHEIDADLPLVDAGLLRDHLAARTAPRRFTLALAVFLASLALVIALVGVGGLATFVGTRQRRQVAVRMALGAGRSRAVVPAVRAPVTGVAVGVIVGVAGVVLASPVIRTLLYGVEPFDPWTLGGAAVAVVGAAGACALLPAFAATRADLRDVMDG